MNDVKISFVSSMSDEYVKSNTFRNNILKVSLLKINLCMKQFVSGRSR